jgi:acylphosphatase
MEISIILRATDAAVMRFKEETRQAQKEGESMRKVKAEKLLSKLEKRRTQVERRRGKQFP